MATMKENSTTKHSQQLPSARKIRRSCDRELYRALKRLNVWVPEEAVKEAEKLYFRKVILNLQWITENSSNRKLLSDWWDENVGPEIAELWKIDKDRLCSAFRQAFGG